MSGVASTLAKKRARAAGFGTNANANKYLNQDFEALRSQCQAQGQLFCDPCFPAAPESLGFRELGPNSSKTRGVQWKRPGVSIGRTLYNESQIQDKPFPCRFSSMEKYILEPFRVGKELVEKLPRVRHDQIVQEKLSVTFRNVT